MTTRSVAAAMKSVDRRDFLPEDQRRLWRDDNPLSIGFGQSNSQPTTVANMLDLLDVGEGMKVLDVGAGSGWTTALLAHLVGPEGQVVGVELVPDLVVFGSQNLGRYGFAWAGIHQANVDQLGWSEDGPYDRILVSAGARSVPEQLVEQLGEGGVMVIPVNGVMLRVEKLDDLPPLITQHGHYRFVPLLGDL